MGQRADISIANYLQANGYHPRSSKHGDALCQYLLLDLIATCAHFRTAAERDEIVFQTNYTIALGSVDQWNADLVIGPPAPGCFPATHRVGPIAQGDPEDIWMAVDAKTIMTEHGKARRNRQRDLNSFQDILHRKSRRTIVGGLLVVNMAEKFRTPLARASGELNDHKNVRRLVEEIVAMMGGLGRAEAGSDVTGLEALGIIVVSHTNVPGEPTQLIVTPPAPQLNDPLSYNSFLDDLCQAFRTRFAS